MKPYQRFQMFLFTMLIGIFVIYIGLDLIAWPFSKFAEMVMAGIWSIVLFLCDPKVLMEMIKKEAGIEDKIIDKSVDTSAL